MSYLLSTRDAADRTFVCERGGLFPFTLLYHHSNVPEQRWAISSGNSLDELEQQMVAALEVVRAARIPARQVDYRLAAGWKFTSLTGWTAPCGTTESEWGDAGWPLPEEPDFAEWFMAFHHYDALDEGTTPVPYPAAPSGFTSPSRS